MGFESGALVWAKVGRVWWPGQVTDEYPDDLMKNLRRPAVAVVKFFSTDGEFEIVKKDADIMPYDHDKKEEFIRKGKLHFAKNEDELAKFIEDSKYAEKETGGDEDLIDRISTAPTGPKKPAYADIFKPLTPVPPPPPPKHGALQFNFKKAGGSPAKKSRTSLPTPQVVDAKNFTCDMCGFTSDRVGVIISHKKSHSAAISETPSTSAAAKARSSTAERSPPKLKPQVPIKNSPEKSKTPSPRKRKAPKEQAKQEILADWSDEEGAEDREKSPIPEINIEQKKPRTHQEMSDAFDSLLNSTKPPELPVFEDAGPRNIRVKEAEKKSESTPASDNDSNKFSDSDLDDSLLLPVLTAQLDAQVIGTTSEDVQAKVKITGNGVSGTESSAEENVPEKIQSKKRKSEALDEPEMTLADKEEPLVKAKTPPSEEPKSEAKKTEPKPVVTRARRSTRRSSLFEETKVLEPVAEDGDKEKSEEQNLIQPGKSEDHSTPQKEAEVLVPVSGRRTSARRSLGKAEAMSAPVIDSPAVGRKTRGRKVSETAAAKALATIKEADTPVTSTVSSPATTDPPAPAVASSADEKAFESADSATPPPHSTSEVSSKESVHTTISTAETKESTDPAQGLPHEKAAPVPLPSPSPVHSVSPPKNVPKVSASPVRSPSSARAPTSPVRNVSPVRATTSPVRAHISPVRANASSARSISPVKTATAQRAPSPVRPGTSPVRNISPVRNASPVKSVVLSNEAVTSTVKTVTSPVKSVTAPVKPASLPIKPVTASAVAVSTTQEAVITQDKAVVTVKTSNEAVVTPLKAVTPSVKVVTSTSVKEPERQTTASTVTKTPPAVPAPASITTSASSKSVAAGNPDQPAPVIATKSSVVPKVDVSKQVKPGSAKPPIIDTKLPIVVKKGIGPVTASDIVKASAAAQKQPVTATKTQFIKEVVAPAGPGQIKAAAPYPPLTGVKARAALQGAKKNDLPVSKPTSSSSSATAVAISTVKPVVPQSKVTASLKTGPSPLVSTAQAAIPPAKAPVSTIQVSVANAPGVQAAVPPAPKANQRKSAHAKPGVPAPNTVRLAAPASIPATAPTASGMVQITARKSVAGSGSGGKSVTFVAGVPNEKVFPKTSAPPPTPQAGTQASLTVKATNQGLQIKPSQPTTAVTTKVTKPEQSTPLKPGPGILKTSTPSGTPVIAVKSAPGTAKGGKGPQVSFQAVSEQILVLPSVTAPQTTTDLRNVTPAASKAKGRSRAKKPPNATGPTTQQVFQVSQGGQQSVVTLKFDPATGQVLQPEICPVISQTLSAKIHGLPLGTAVAPLPPIIVNPDVVQTVQSVTTKVHALPSTSAASTRLPASAGMPALTPVQARQSLNTHTIKAFTPNILSGSQHHQQHTSASQMLQQQQAIAQIVGAPVAYSGATQSFHLVTQSSGGSPPEINLASPPNQKQQGPSTALTASAQVAEGKQKKQAQKKGVQTYGRKDSPTKPTATIKPTMSEEELSSFKLRQALQKPKDKDDTPLVAEKVVHLVPVENQDGTVTYMIVQLDEHGALKIDSAEGPAMTQTPPDAIFVDEPTDAQRILQVLTQPHPDAEGKDATPNKTSPVTSPAQQVTRPAKTLAQSPSVAQSLPVSVVPTHTQMQVASSLAQIPMTSTPVIEMAEQAGVQQTHATQPFVTQQQVFIQANGEENQVQLQDAVSSAEASAGAVPAPTTDMVQVVDAEGNQHILTMEEAAAQGLIQYDDQGQYYTYNEAPGQQQFQMTDGSMLDLSQFAGGSENQILLLQEDGTLIDPVAMGIDISQLIQQQQQQQTTEQS